MPIRPMNPYMGCCKKPPRRFKNGKKKNGDEILLPPQLAEVRRIQQFDHLLLGTKTAAEVPTPEKNHLAVDMVCRFFHFRASSTKRGFKRNGSKKCHLGWWQLKYFFVFQALFGEDEPILTHIFQVGWFNHQLLIVSGRGRNLHCFLLGVHQRWIPTCWGSWWQRPYEDTLPICGHRGQILGIHISHTPLFKKKSLM